MTKIFGKPFNPEKHNPSIFSKYIIPFLNEIHSIKLSEKKQIMIPWHLNFRAEVPSTKPSDFQESFLRMSSKVSGLNDYLGLESIDFLLSDVFDFFKSNLYFITNFDTLCHGDFLRKHIYYNEGDIGVIDFGNAGYCNMSIDDRYILFPNIDKNSSRKGLISGGNLYNWESNYEEYLDRYHINQLPFSCIILNELLLYWNRIKKGQKNLYFLLEDNRKVLLSFSKRFL